MKIKFVSGIHESLVIMSRHTLSSIHHPNSEHDLLFCSSLAFASDKISDWLMKANLANFKYLELCNCGINYSRNTQVHDTRQKIRWSMNNQLYPPLRPCQACIPDCMPKRLLWRAHNCLL